MIISYLTYYIETRNRQRSFRFLGPQLELTHHQTHAYLWWSLRAHSYEYLEWYGSLLPCALVQLVPCLIGYQRRLHSSFMECIRWVFGAFLVTYSTTFPWVLVGPHPHGHHSLKHPRYFLGSRTRQMVRYQVIRLARQKGQEEHLGLGSLPLVSIYKQF